MAASDCIHRFDDYRRLSGDTFPSGACSWLPVQERIQKSQSLAGHGDIQITMNRYVDPSKQNLLKATETLESLLFSDDKVKDTTSAESIAS